MYITTHTYIYTYIYTYICTYICTHTHIYIHHITHTHHIIHMSSICHPYVIHMSSICHPYIWSLQVVAQMSKSLQSTIAEDEASRWIFWSHGGSPVVTMVVSILSHGHPWLGWFLGIPMTLDTSICQNPLLRFFSACQAGSFRNVKCFQVSSVFGGPFGYLFGSQDPGTARDPVPAGAEEAETLTPSPQALNGKSSPSSGVSSRWRRWWWNWMPRMEVSYEWAGYPRNGGSTNHRGFKPQHTLKH
jgi:hypothetical protein